jgi:hypothetical protein
MLVRMTKTEILDSILLCLADAFEAGNRTGRTITHASLEEYEVLRECIAELVAECSVIDPQGMKIYHLTKSGYLKYKPRIDALRVLRASS